jgi:hypothetical protein
MLKNLFITLLFSITLAARAQDYAVTQQGDTLRGKLRHYSYDNLDRLQVTSKDKKKTNFTALQVRLFVKDGVTYRPIKYENTIRFMKVIKSGYLSLLAYSATQQGLFDGRYLLKRDDSGVDLPNISFKRIIAKYLSDCPQVKDKVEKGDFHKSDIEKIVDEYNTCIEANTVQLMATTNATGTSSYKNEKIEAVKRLREKVEAENFLTKKDVIDLLNDMHNKLSRNEAVPNFLTDGLKSYLTDTPALSKEADELIALLKK